LEEAGTLADLLVVAVNSDRSTRAYKGEGRPIVPEAERAELVAALASVDFVVIFDEPDVKALILELKPELQVKGTDYTPDSIPEAEAVRSYGGRVVIAGDPKNHSSTAMIAAKAEQAEGRTPSNELGELKSVLGCPQCRSIAVGLEWDDVKAEVWCRPCELAFPVRKGIPVLLLSEARPHPTSET
jgi:rfaE bifunctional protein nucleotidyltransferase chain/domain